MTAFVTYQRRPENGFLAQYIEAMMETMSLTETTANELMRRHHEDVEFVKKAAVREAMDKVRKHTYIVASEVNHG